MASNPITQSLPADLPTNWVYGQTVGPEGTDVGLTEQHGYNYLMEQVNAAQNALKEVGESYSELVSVEEGGTIPGSQISPDDVLKFGASGTSGLWDRQESAPTATTPIRYNGYLQATRVYGMYYSNDADYAEAYEVEGEIEPGELVMICPDGTLRKNTIQENHRVLGIVSGSPAAVIGGKGVPIALAGRVPVKAVGRVFPGDFLVGAGTPGAVMACGDAPRGAVVAQALAGCESGGTILARVLRL